MNLSTIREEVYKILSKDQYSGEISPEEWTIAFNHVKERVMDDLVGEFERTQEISNALLPLIVTQGDSNSVPIAVDSYGYYEIPEDYRYFVRASYLHSTATCKPGTYKQRKIELVKQDDYIDRVSSTTLVPSIKRPITTVQNSKFIVFPVVTPIRLTYIKKHPEVFFDYDIISGDVIYLAPGSTHDDGSASQSVEFVFGDGVRTNIVEYLVLYFSKNDRSAFGVQTAQIEQK